MIRTMERPSSPKATALRNAKPSPTEAYEVRAGGLVLLEAHSDADLATFRNQLQHGLVDLRRAFGPEIRLRLGTRFKIDPLEAIYGERTMEKADAILDIEADLGLELDDVLNKVSALANLGPAIDYSRSAISLGSVTHIRRFEPEGSESLSFLGRKAPGVTFSRMSKWWFGHADLTLQLQNGMECRWSYAQFRVDRAASQRASSAAGMPTGNYDMGDIVTIADRKQFLDWVGSAEVAAQLHEDEIGFLDQTSWRGGLTEFV